ncbi:MAG: anthranilate synthase component I family protein, partial [Actinobacteria bacterium]|nr:anthranilate synthase component I family protein [Actinomycetota bacterium]
MEKLPQTVIDDIKNPLFYFIYYSKLISYSHKNCKWYLICNFNLKDCHDSYCDSIIYKNSISGLSFNNINNAVTESIFSESVNYRNSGIRTDISVKENKKLLYRLIDECIYQREKIASILDEEEFKKAAGLQGLKEVYGIKRLKESVILDLIVEKYLNRQINSIKLKSNFTKKEYLKAVLKAKEYIHNGDIYQVNMTQRFTSDLGVEPYDLYYILRQKNAAPFSAYLGFPELKVGSSSPERFLFLKEGMIETRPIKGTRPRGIDRIEDYRFINELKNSTKDRAELNMIVDLERNDLGRFCEYGTVKVKEHAVIEKYAKVFHLVSTVTGKVRKGYGIVDILKATFPGGSITGAPKIRAMEIIDELEPNVRSIYTGTIGYIGIDGTMDLNIVIRTFIIKGKRFYYNVGGGIVEDSEPYPEY